MGKPSSTLLILVVCGGLVVYPVVFLAEAALNVGDPQEFPLQEWGLGNFAALGEDWHILANTGLVACIATVMAVIFGFVVAWILTRTRVPGGARLERLMELPYYMTPLVGALAWAILASPHTGCAEPALALASAAAAISSTSIRRAASPGSWRCSRAPSPL